MPTFKVAQIEAPGVNLLVVPIDSLNLETDLERQRVRDEIQARATEASLSGTVILVWKKAFGDMEFLAPFDLHESLAKATYDQILEAANTRLSWE
jgi:hypothetical protein